MSDLSTATPEELAEGIEPYLQGLAAPKERLSELVTRANTGDLALKAAGAAHRERRTASEGAKWAKEQRERAEAAEARLAMYEEPGWITPVQKVIELQARLAEAEEALEKIASVPCQIACESLPDNTRCVTCIARAALAALREKP